MKPILPAPASHSEINDQVAQALFDEEKWIAADVERNRLKALPMEQTPAYNKALEKQMTAHLRSGSVL